MKDRFRNFMTGRYGGDQLNRFLLWVSIATLIVSFFAGRFVFYLLSFSILILIYYRTFSRQFTKRYHENMLYLKYRDRFLQFCKKAGHDIMQRKTHHIYRCPSCSQRIRIPRGKGKVIITCPRCRMEFAKRSW